MNLAYESRHFGLDEYLPEPVFLQLAKDNMLWKGWLMLDERLLRTDDALRDKFGALTINDWHRGGHRVASGLRIPGQAEYKPTSQHSFGRASDKISASLSADDMRKYILAHPDDFPLLTAMEQGVNWLHTDVRNCTRISLVNPT